MPHPVATSIAAARMTITGVGIGVPAAEDLHGL